jgi:hypothetical protein
MQLLSTVTLAMLQASYLVSAVALRNSNVETRATPAVCWDTCNNAVLEIDAVGATNICSDSAYVSYLDACEECAEANGGDTGSFPQLIFC